MKTVCRLTITLALGLPVGLLAPPASGVDRDPSATSAGRSQAPAASGFAGVSEVFPTGSAAIDSAGLVGAYDMETFTADGRLRDFSRIGNHGTIRRHQALDGPIGGGRAFRTVEDRIHIGENAAFDLDGPLTIAAWLRVDETGLHQHVVACDDKWALWITPDDRFRLGDTRGGGVSTDPGGATAGRWTSVVAVLRGGRDDPLNTTTVVLYVDGRPADAAAHLRTDAARAAGTWSPGDLYPSDACYIGFESHQGNEAHQQMPFVGAIDELLVFARAWTDDEVLAFARR